MSENEARSYEFGDFRLDLVNFRLLENGEQVALTQKSFELLEHLIENRGRVLKKEELLDALWEGNFVEEANLTQHIYMLRKALGQKGGEHNFIETIPKTGYRFVAEVAVSYDDVHSSGSDEPFGVENRSFASETDPGTGVPTYSHADPGARTGGAGDREKGARRFRNPLLAVAGLILICTGLIFTVIFFAGLSGQVRAPGTAGSIAVLPFKQIAGEKDEKLGLGIADVIIAKLANLENIAVRPTTSIIRFADEETDDLFEVGRKLNVDYVIEGSIQRENGTVRVTTQLYSVENKKQVWTETFDEEYTDIFSLQDAISERIAQRVAIGLEKGEGDFPFKQYTRDADAYRAYSTGLSYWSQHSKVGFESAIPHFEDAIERDPHFALAYAYLADTYAHHTFLSAIIDREKALRLGEEMANKALKLDSECAEAMAAKALIYATRKRGAEAFALMRESLRLKPNDAHSRHRISWMYANRGELDIAVKEMRRALELDPQSTYLNLYLAHFLYLARDPAEARKYCERTLKIDPGSSEAKWRLLQIQEMEGRYEKVESALRQALGEAPDNNAVQLFLSRIYAKTNRPDKARSLLSDALKHEESASYALLVASAQVALGERDKAMSRIEELVRNAGIELFVLRSAPNLDPLRSDPRFAALIRDMEVSEGWAAGN